MRNNFFHNIKDQSTKQVVKLLVRNGANPNQVILTLGAIWTPLFLAIHSGMPNAVEALLESGADPNIQGLINIGNNKPITPLFFAMNYDKPIVYNASKERHLIVELLIKYGAK